MSQYVTSCSQVCLASFVILFVLSIKVFDDFFQFEDL